MIVVTFRGVILSPAILSLIGSSACVCVFVSGVVCVVVTNVGGSINHLFNHLPPAVSVMKAYYNPPVHSCFFKPNHTVM